MITDTWFDDVSFPGWWVLANNSKVMYYIIHTNAVLGARIMFKEEQIQFLILISPMHICFFAYGMKNNN